MSERCVIEDMDAAHCVCGQQSFDDVDLYEIWLTVQLKHDPLAAVRAINAFGDAKSVYSSAVNGGSGGLEKRLKLDKFFNDGAIPLKNIKNIVEICRRKNISILTIDHENYPAKLRQICDAPRVLYVKGSLKGIDNRLCVTVIGTRTPTEYGLKIAEKLAFDLAYKGVLVISGMAKGIDACAHWGAIAATDKTVAVVGCGVDVVYPACNADLYRKILQCGAVISEYPPGVRGHRFTFPQRNRIMAALSMGVLVVEGADRSGTRHTVNRAEDYNRDVFAVPGNIDSPNSYMPNELIKEGAVPVTAVDDILKVYDGVYGHMISSRAERCVSDSTGDIACALDAQKYDILNSTEQMIVKYLYINGKSHADKISVSCGLSAATFNSAVMLLQMKGIIKEIVGKNYEYVK